jgi:hypothetical protein
MFQTAANDRFALADDFQVGDSSFQAQNNVRFAALTGGGFIATWTGQDGFNDSGIRAQIFDNNGRPVGSEFGVNASTTGVEADPAVIALPSGGFLITWADDSVGGPDGFDIHCQMFDAQAHRVGTEFIANSTTASFQLSPEVALLASGGFVVTWETPNSTFRGISAQVFDANGAKVGSEFSVTDSQPGDKGAPTIAALAGGGFVAGWFDRFKGAAV